MLNLILGLQYRNNLLSSILPLVNQPLIQQNQILNPLLQQQINLSQLIVPSLIAQNLQKKACTEAMKLNQNVAPLLKEPLEEQILPQALSENLKHKESLPLASTNSETSVSSIEEPDPNDSVLMQLILRILDGNQLSKQEIEALESPISRKIIEAVILKKNTANDKAKATKRKEESRKIFFRSLFKKMEKDFFANRTNNPAKISKVKKTDYNLFYYHYWGEVAQQRGIDISNFYNPNKNHKKKGKGSGSQLQLPKSLNEEYIHLILSSSSFKSVALEFLERGFQQGQVDSREKKIRKLLSHLQNVAKQMSTSTKDTAAVANELYNYILTNPKSKLPWSKKELEDVLSTCVQFFM